MKSKDIIKEASVMDQPGEKKIHKNPLFQPLIPAPKQSSAPPTEADKFVASMLPGVGTAMDVKDIAGGDYSAIPYMALGLLPGGGLLKKGAKTLGKKLFG